MQHYNFTKNEGKVKMIITEHFEVETLFHFTQCKILVSVGVIKKN